MLLVAMIVLGVMMYKQNDLLHAQTATIINRFDRLNCIMGIDIFVHQFPRGQVDWGELPVQLYTCLPEYTKKLPAAK